MTEPAIVEQPDPQPWRCTSTNPYHPDVRCWLPDGHNGRDASNNWDLHANQGEQW